LVEDSAGVGIDVGGTDDIAIVAATDISIFRSAHEGCSIREARALIERMESDGNGRTGVSIDKRTDVTLREVNISRNGTGLSAVEGASAYGLSLLVNAIVDLQHFAIVDNGSAGIADLSSSGRWSAADGVISGHPAAMISLKPIDARDGLDRVHFRDNKSVVTVP
jgi:hypothetical protein